MSFSALTIAVIVAYASGCLVYVYRWRGTTRYAALKQYLRKSWPIFAPLNCLLYMATPGSARRPVLDSGYLKDISVLRDNWRTIRAASMRSRFLKRFAGAMMPAHSSPALLATGACAACMEVTLNDLDHPRLVNAPILASESATNGAYSGDGERISYTVDGLFKRELHVTTPATMGASSTLVSPAGGYLSSFRLDPSGRVVIMLVGDQFLLVNLDAPDRTLKLADESYDIGYLEAIAPR